MHAYTHAHTHTHIHTHTHTYTHTHTHTHLDMVAMRSEREAENLEATVGDFLRLLLPSAVDDFSSRKRLEIN